MSSIFAFSVAAGVTSFCLKAAGRQSCRGEAFTASSASITKRMNCHPLADIENVENASPLPTITYFTSIIFFTARKSPASIR